jgi:hypothetical protein
MQWEGRDHQYGKNMQYVAQNPWDALKVATQRPRSCSKLHVPWHKPLISTDLDDQYGDLNANTHSSMSVPISDFDLEFEDAP